MQRILSGIQPSGTLHIGNYLGALRNFVDLQNAGNECFYVIVDLHALCGDYDPKAGREKTVGLAADFMAAGLDPKKSTIFIQSQVPEHTELMWILSSVTPVSELGRMTQFKDKSARQAKNINTGLFTYPVLQAADILLYRPDAVPVGHDQKQHLELTNDIARKFNAKFGEEFSEVKPLWTKFPRVMSLKDPTKKMSKSDPAGCLFLDDEPEAIHEKLKKAVTATDSSSKSSGAANLMLLLAEFGERAEVIHFTEAERDGTLRFSEVKEVLAERVAERFAAFRAAKRELLARPDQIAEALGEGARRAQKVAAKTMLEVKEKIGLL